MHVGFSLTYKLIFKAFLIGLVFRFTHVTTSIHCSSNNFLKLYKSWVGDFCQNCDQVLTKKKTFQYCRELYVLS